MILSNVLYISQGLAREGRQSKGLKQTVNGSCAVLYGGMLEDDGSSWGEKRKMVVVHRGKRGRK
jgi:hypothetical protein